MNFNSILGQNSALKIIQADMKGGNLSGAYLFSGPSGVGKLMAGVSFAKALNCKEDNLIGCERCSSCIKMEKSNHPNLRLISPEGKSIKIDQIRNLKIESGYTLYEGKKKVWIINEAEKLTQEAVNSLLKILEEPPNNVIIILITHVPTSFPSTILSRCRIVQFVALSHQCLSEILKKRNEVTPHLIPLISELAQGSMSEALKFTQEKDIFQEREIIFKLIQKRKSLSLEVFKLSERWSAKKNSIETLLNMVLFFLRDILMLKVGTSFALFNQDKKDELFAIKDVYSFSDVYKGIEAVEESKIFLRANVSTQLVLEGMWIKIIYPECA